MNKQKRFFIKIGMAISIATILTCSTSFASSNVLEKVEYTEKFKNWLQLTEEEKQRLNKIIGKKGKDFMEFNFIDRLKELPKNVEASGEENVAVTILPVHNNKSIIIARSESGAKNIYTVNYVLEESEGSADINEDGSINVGDLSIVSKYQGEVISGNALSEKSDINKDGVVDKADIQIVMDKILGE